MNNLESAWIEVTIETGTKFILDPVDEAEKVEQAIKAGWTVKPLYYTPAQNQWQGLTNEEINVICGSEKPSWERHIVELTETKLREKNNGQT